jgi:hypothetical protein
LGETKNPRRVSLLSALAMTLATAGHPAESDRHVRQAMDLAHVLGPLEVGRANSMRG